MELYKLIPIGVFLLAALLMLLAIPMSSNAGVEKHELSHSEACRHFDGQPMVSYKEEFFIITEGTTWCNNITPEMQQAYFLTSAIQEVKDYQSGIQMRYLTGMLAVSSIVTWLFLLMGHYTKGGEL